MAQGSSIIRTQTESPYGQHHKNKEWWANQPSEAIDTVERVAVMMGIPVSLLGENYDALNLLRVMTAATSLTN